MAYSDFTFDDLSSRLGLILDDRATLFEGLALVNVPPTLTATIERWLPFASQMNIEKAKSEFVIGPILMELRVQKKDVISLFSGIDFNIDHDAGLVGRCDFILARSPLQVSLKAPAVMFVEAKREDIIGGIPQCFAEMVAAQRFNGTDQEPIYGVVTTGLLWRFLCLKHKHAAIDMTDYPIQQLDRIYSILTHIAVGSETQI